MHLHLYKANLRLLTGGGHDGYNRGSHVHGRECPGDGFNRFQDRHGVFGG